MRIPWLTPCAIALVVLANALALMHAARNRWGEPDTEVELTEREVSLVRPEDQSGVVLRLSWSGPSLSRPGSNQDSDSHDSWLDPEKLSALGFDCSVPASATDAPDHYRRLPVRRCYLALRLNESPPEGDAPATRLVAVDAALEATDLRVRHPDRDHVIILPAAISVQLEGRGNRETPEGRQKARIRGWVSYLPRDINVPRPFSDQLRPLPAGKPSFSVRLRYGALYEPWVTAVSTP